MGSTSVTGVASVNRSKEGSEHTTIGVSHLIGPRMDEEKARIMDTHRKLVKSHARLLELHASIIEEFVLGK